MDESEGTEILIPLDDVQRFAEAVIYLADQVVD